MSFRKRKVTSSPARQNSDVAAFHSTQRKVWIVVRQVWDHTVMLLHMCGRTPWHSHFLFAVPTHLLAQCRKTERNGRLLQSEIWLSQGDWSHWWHSYQHLKASWRAVLWRLLQCAQEALHNVAPGSVAKITDPFFVVVSVYMWKITALLQVSKNSGPPMRSVKCFVFAAHSSGWHHHQNHRCWAPWLRSRCSCVQTVIIVGSQWWVCGSHHQLPTISPFGWRGLPNQVLCVEAIPWWWLSHMQTEKLQQSALFNSECCRTRNWETERAFQVSSFPGY